MTSLFQCLSSLFHFQISPRLSYIWMRKAHGKVKRKTKSQPSGFWKCFWIGWYWFWYIHFFILKTSTNEYVYLGGYIDNRCIFWGYVRKEDQHRKLMDWKQEVVMHMNKTFLSICTDWSTLRSIHICLDRYMYLDIYLYLHLPAVHTWTVAGWWTEFSCVAGV